MATPQKPPPIDLAKETPLRIEQAAELMGVHRRTIENWLSRGLPYIKIGRIRFTTREAIARFAQPSNAVPQHQADEQAMSEALEAKKVLRDRFGF